VTRQLEKMKADLGVDLERAGRVRTPLPTTTPEDADGGQRSPIPEIPARVKDGRPEVHARALRAELREPNPPVRQNFPTLREVRAFQQLQSDPTEFSRHIPRYTEAEQWGAASIEGHPPPPKYNTQQVQEGLPPSQQGKKLTSGLARKAHDRVVREVSWPHEYVFSATTTVTYDSLTYDQFVAGEMSIILSAHTHPTESRNRGHILRGLMLDVPTYTFRGVKNFFKILLIHVEHGLVNIDTNTTLAEVYKLKEDHLRRPSSEMEQGHAHGGPQQAASTERAGGPRSTYCYRYQANTCSFATDHISASGTLHVHACKYCSRNRPEVDASHPAKFCPFNRDRGRQSGHSANRDSS